MTQIHNPFRCLGGLLSEHFHDDYCVLVDPIYNSPRFLFKEIQNAELPAGAVLSADPSGRGYATERAVDGIHMGSFTWAFVRVIQAAPQGIGAAIGDVFSATSAIELAQNYGLTARQVNSALKAIREHENEIREAWATHFG